MATTAEKEKRDSESFHEYTNAGGRKAESTQNINAKLANPLAGLSHEQLIQDAKDFAKRYDLDDLSLELQKGALVAQDTTLFETLPLLDEDDRIALRRELTHRWDQPKMLYYLVILCSVAAAVQGMDETVINGAQLFFPKQFGIDPNTQDGNASKNQWILGLVNSAPYLCCAVLGCWLTHPLNQWFGRRGTIFITALFSFLTCIWQGVTNSWEHLFVARFILGIGIVRASPPIRGALVMMWQTWTAFGIMLGFVADLAFYRVPDKPHITGLNWRLMLSSAGLPALFIVVQVFFCPESPRWYMMKGRYREAYNSLLRLRHKPIQAARDLYYIHVQLETEKQITRDRSKLWELFSIPRNRRATLASGIVMFICGINVIAYYSSNIFSEANFTEIQALLASWGFGMVNWLFAFPAVWTIDTFGRRNLLLTTFPLMTIFLLLTGFAFWIPEENEHARIGVIALGIYLFTMAYSPGEGPVPFTYSAEAFPLYIRDLGMSYATVIICCFYYIPRLLGAFKPQGAFGWYAAWNVFGFFAILLFLPETKALSLEELDQVFSVPTHVHAAYQIKALPHNIKKYIFKMNLEGAPKTYAPGGAGHA
ncbi:uncharacterized protein EV420DRAFT_1623247 [Desarmillaria tabescens]|uniref:Major facilitator superfamily (MFS) profile domain-containing protein n=1 Tax=Armillaria tabescens TaxID=1929756 RepID=A0AA39MMC0_ARMTA|nr:uncharacterized protein EV420DRAFT_1623247 [Desarmillaria tabescens]KAK0438695.1 hypothetical protein EV420DRAFT_1623247 [Desarmillaria tabescens]